jgi:hypothetical protein
MQWILDDIFTWYWWTHNSNALRLGHANDPTPLEILLFGVVFGGHYLLYSFKDKSPLAGKIWKYVSLFWTIVLAFLILGYVKGQFKSFIKDLLKDD